MRFIIVVIYFSIIIINMLYMFIIILYLCLYLYLYLLPIPILIPVPLPTSIIVCYGRRCSWRTSTRRWRAPIASSRGYYIISYIYIYIYMWYYSISVCTIPEDSSWRKRRAVELGGLVDLGLRNLGICHVRNVKYTIIYIYIYI